MIFPIKPGENKKIGGMNVYSFMKSHSAIEPVSYTLVASKKVSVITNVEYVCENIEKAVKNSDAIFF